MSLNFPGAFPGSFSSSNNKENNPFQDPAQHQTQFSSIFSFTPAEQSTSLYPNLSHLSNSNSNNHNANFLSRECEKLGYSNKLTNNVLSELDQRASSKMSSSRLKSTMSPRSRNAFPTKRFNRMESISSHYAAVRQQNERAMNEDVIEIEKENIPSYDPNSKREMDSSLSNISKRRRTELGSKKVLPVHSTLSSSKRTNDINSILNRSTASNRTSRTSTRTSVRTQPTTNIPSSDSRCAVPTSSSFRFNPSKTSRESTSSQPQSRPSMTSNNLFNITNTMYGSTTKRLPKSSTIENLSKPTLSSLSKSTSTRNLENVRTTSSIPRSKTTRFGDLNSSSTIQQRPVWR